MIDNILNYISQDYNTFFIVNSMGDVTFGIGGFWGDRIAITQAPSVSAQDQAISGLFSYKVANTGLVC